MGCVKELVQDQKSSSVDNSNFSAYRKKIVKVENFKCQANNESSLCSSHLLLRVASHAPDLKSGNR